VSAILAKIEKAHIPAADALEVARKLVRYLKPRCEKIMVAGSLRRRKPMVRDVEILFVPKYERETDPGDLFGASHQVDIAERAIAALLSLGVIAKRPKCDGTFTWGAENKLAVHMASGIPIDLFATTQEKWFNALVVRTGPKASNQAIASAAIARGWTWHAYGNGFTRVNPSGSKIVGSEREVFDFVGLPYLEPWER
jgi:DNA polymerase/3'-5' exonuclease PolX